MMSQLPSTDVEMGKFMPLYGTRLWELVRLLGWYVCILSTKSVSFMLNLSWGLDLFRVAVP